MRGLLPGWLLEEGVMSIHRRAAKRDSNEREIIALWRRLGCWVESVSGKGSPDTRVHYDGDTWRCEVKGARRGLTEAQVENFTAAHKHDVPTYVIRTLADAANLLETTLEPWKPEDGALAGAARKERKHKPGHSRARRVSEQCGEPFCPRSRVHGEPWCRTHVPPNSLRATGRRTP